MRSQSFRDLWLLCCLVLALGACAGTPPGAVVQSKAPAPGGTPRPATTQALQTAQAEALSDGAPVGIMPTPTVRQTAAAPAGAEATSPSPDTVPATPAAPTGAESADQLTAMREEVFLTGAPLFAIANRCEMPQELPAGGHAATWTSTLDSGLLCMFGFAENEVVRYEVRDATGEIVVTGEATPDNLDGDPQSSVKVLVSIAGNAPGVWTSRGVGTGGSVHARFTVQAVTAEGRPAVSLALRPPPGSVKSGAQISITGYGLPTGSPVQLGVYEILSQNATGAWLQLHEATELQVDADGKASAALDLDPSYHVGAYCVVLSADPAYEPTEDISELGAARCFEVTED